MDDAGTNRARGILRTLRLALLMIVGAGVGRVVFGQGVGNFLPEVEKNLPAALFEAFCGLAIEGLIRATWIDEGYFSH